MTHFFFDVRSNGRLSEDERGRRFDNVQQASAYATQRMPFLLRKDIRRANTYVTTAIRDETRTVCVVRGTITLESRC